MSKRSFLVLTAALTLAGMVGGVSTALPAGAAATAAPYPCVPNGPAGSQTVYGTFGDASVIGWAGNSQGVVACLGGSFWVDTSGPDGGPGSASTAAVTGTTYGYGIYDDSPATWTNADRTGPGGIMEKTNDIDANGYWTIDNYEALTGLWAYRWLAQQVGDAAEASWAGSQYSSLLAATSKTLDATISAGHLNYLPCSMTEPNTDNRCANAEDANWAAPFQFMISNAQSEPYAWWESQQFPNPGSPWAGVHPESGNGSSPHAWGMANANMVLLDSLAAQRADGSLVVGRGVPSSWVRNGQVVSLANFPTTSGRHLGLTIRTSGLQVTLTLTGQPPSGPVLFQLPAFVGNVAHASAGTVDEQTGTVTLASSVRSVTVQLTHPESAGSSSPGSDDRVQLPPVFRG